MDIDNLTIEELKKIVLDQQKELNELREKKNNIVDYKKNYYQEKTKNKVRYCRYCDKDIIFNSYANHVKSSKCKENAKKYLENNF
jgi:hypothetical protein